jgi:hypothetical protein
MLEARMDLLEAQRQQPVATAPMMPIPIYYPPIRATAPPANFMNL